ncbi:MAG TPA: DUF2796 domain-containing protein, partial [Lamprocystis sp. (in: g-proteobacteria)]|nr:DUF2796 domain-containing protein [Lamprocystis sp. (in: g-proteobacteria)]
MTPRPDGQAAWRRFLIMALGLCVQPLLGAATPAAGTASLTIRVLGGTVHVALSAPALTLVGFAGPPGDAAQREDLKLAAHNLKTGDAVVRFNPQAQCVLEAAKVDADPGVRNGTADLGASYRFGCALP